MDLSSIVSLIMENPRIISEITSLVKERESGTVVSQSETSTTAAREDEPTVKERVPEISERRQALFSALKPYVSEKRARAIDSMMTIAEMIELMRAR